MTIEDVEGEWVNSWDMRDKYLRRPAVLHHCSFAQFARMYSTCKTPKPGEDVDTLEDVDQPDEADEEPPQKPKQQETTWDSFKILARCKGLCCQERKNKLSRRKQPGKLVDLPPRIEIEKPNSGEGRHMQRRNIPATLRYFKAKKQKNLMMYFYQELLLYVPFGRPENEHLGTKDLLTSFDTKKEAELYIKHMDHIAEVKSTIMPRIEDVEEERYYVEEARKQERIETEERIGNSLAPGKEQDNQDALQEEPQHDTDFIHLDPSLVEEVQDKETFQVTSYGRITVPNKNVLCERTRSLDKDQRRVIDIVANYLKDIVKARKHDGTRPKPPHLMIHGAAGTGKSTIIDLGSMWAQHMLQGPGDNPDHPFVIKAAFTGTAAANICGQTLSSTFNFTYGNQHIKLSDKKRDKTKIALKNLEILAIDEISMVKADMLYQLDLKLQEIKERRGVPFGGVMIAAFGDIFQLPPVAGRPVYARPSNVQYHNTFDLENRWEMLAVINLTENHRQGEDKPFVDLLNRLRFVQRGDMLPEDIKTLKNRIRPEKNPDLQGAAINVVCKRAKAFKMNMKNLKKLPGDETVIKAVHYKKDQKSFKPKIEKKDGSIGTTAYMDELRLKIGAKVMLLRNIDTSDSLTNGQTGILTHIEIDTSGSVRYLVVTFDRKTAGQRSRDKNPQLAAKHPGGTKIELREEAYSLSKTGHGATAYLVQFPITLAHATTAHKTQGMTVHKPKTSNLDIASTFESCQGYVMLGRNQALEQVFISKPWSPEPPDTWLTTHI